MLDFSFCSLKHLPQSTIMIYEPASSEYLTQAFGVVKYLVYSLYLGFFVQKIQISTN
ncbi:hypothetical protein HDF22_003699 [Mucilaginibacter lappiensis]|uniref:Uncharacterized protein n=1 Tax=Mucilaginibacter lappiensis TaxID=354630 RepID=A0A841JLH5_9SPHI|nr:hypothetical protein [Mucilaginibacter lappiensis]